MISKDGRMNEEAGERFAGMTAAEALRGGRGGTPRASAGSPPRSPTRTRSRSRIAPESESSR